jgi:hypothetical protein
MAKSATANPSSPPPAGAAAPSGWRGDAALEVGAGSRKGRGPRKRGIAPVSETTHRPGPAELIRRASEGETLREREKRGLTLGDRLAVQRAERHLLQSMTPQERLRTYRRGGLSGYQLSVWWSLYPREIPRINDVPEWIAATLADICEHSDYEQRCRKLGVSRLTGRPT